MGGRYPSQCWVGLAIDGKSLRGSAEADGPPVHVVSAFATDLGLVLGQEKVAGKSNEITAIPILLDALYLKGFLVSSDAMGCQKDIAAKIVAKGSDYLLAVKGNQPKLFEHIRNTFTDQRRKMDPHEHAEKSHGRMVIQRTRAAPAENIVNTTDWTPIGAVTLNPERDSIIKTHLAANRTQPLAA